MMVIIFTFIYYADTVCSEKKNYTYIFFWYGRREVINTFNIRYIIFVLRTQNIDGFPPYFDWLDIMYISLTVREIYNVYQSEIVSI